MENMEVCNSNCRQIIRLKWLKSAILQQKFDITKLGDRIGFIFTFGEAVHRKKEEEKVCTLFWPPFIFFHFGAPGRWSSNWWIRAIGSVTLAAAGVNCLQYLAQAASSQQTTARDSLFGGMTTCCTNHQQVFQIPSNRGHSSTITYHYPLCSCPLWCQFHPWSWPILAPTHAGSSASFSIPYSGPYFYMHRSNFDVDRSSFHVSPYFTHQNFLDRSRLTTEILSPLAFYMEPRNALYVGIMVINIAVFGLWKAAHHLPAPRLLSFLSKHFVCNKENFAEGRLHTALTSGISHWSVGHLLLNLWGLDLLVRTAGRPGGMLVSEAIEVYGLGAITASAGQVFLRGGSVIGASGAVMALVAAEASLFPQDSFISVFPIPGLTFTSLQICHISALLNAFLGLISSFRGNIVSRSSILNTVAWHGHFCGLIGGMLYASYKAHLTQNSRWTPIGLLSNVIGKYHWLASLADVKDSVDILRIRWRLIWAQNSVEWDVLHREILRIKQQRQMRRDALKHMY